MSEILFADDDAAMRQMVSEVLTAAGHRVRLADGGAAALAEIRRHAPDLVVLDYRMGPPDGFTVCREIKTTPRFAHLPVLILTAESTTSDRLGGFDAGADDYLGKPFDSRELLARVRALLRLAERGLDRNPTSGLPGGEAIHREFLSRALAGRPFSLAYLDLDHFKAFGDRFGFAVADGAIRLAADTLLAAADDGDFVGHIGGDDFLVLCEPERARALVERTQSEFDRRLAAQLPREVAATGVFRGRGRDGVVRDFPVTRLSAAILHVREGANPDLAEVGEAAAALKQEAKRSGLGGVVERDWSGGGS